MSNSTASPTLRGWLIRDGLIATILTVGLVVAHVWTQSADHWSIAAVSSIYAFLSCYILCYVVHEWGHYLGARWSGVDMPLAPYKSPVLGLFRIEDYDRRQYLWLSWGGDLGHVAVTLLAVLVYLRVDGSLVAAAFAIGGLAFSVQALAVDQPIIWQVTRGDDILATADAGTRPEMILKRTWQTWIPLSLIVGAFALS